MHPKVNPNIKFEEKEGSFSYIDQAEEKPQPKPVDPLAAFICSHCDGNNTEEDITNKVREYLTKNAQEPSEDLQSTVNVILNTLSEQGIIFIE